MCRRSRIYEANVFGEGLGRGGEELSGRTSKTGLADNNRGQCGGGLSHARRGCGTKTSEEETTSAR